MGYTALTRCTLQHQFDTSFRLISRGANLNSQNKDGKTALVFAVMDDNLEAVKFLLEKGADPHIEDHQGLDACDYAKGGALEEIRNIDVFKNCPKLQ